MDYDHVKKQLGYGIQTESKDNAIKAIEQLAARVRELEQQRDELAKALSLTIDCWECEAFLTDEVVNISREALSVFEG